MTAAALQSLGIEAINQGRYADGADLLRQTLALNPDDARCHANLAVALDRLGIDGKSPELREEAVTECLEALRLQPDFTEAACNLGVILTNLGRPAEALPHLEQAAAATPASVKAARGYAEALAQLARWDEALPHLVHWTKLEPDSPIAWMKLGECHAHRGQWAEAAAHHQTAYELDPGSAEVVSVLVAALSELGRNAEALYVLFAALQDNPADAVVWSNLGCIWRKLGRQESSLECFDHAATLAPDLVPAAWGRSLALLSMGRMEDGWRAHEWGLETGDRQPLRKFAPPRWDGSDPTGKTLLVWMEQGIGDHIAFAGMLPDLIRTGARCVVECEHRLMHLLRRSFPAVEFVPQTDPPHARTQEPDIDIEIPAGSLMQWFRPNLGSFPHHTGYLTPDPERAAEWKRRIDAIGPGPKIGIAWRSLKPTSKFMDSMALSQWGPILTIPGVHWVNLQCGWREDELQDIGDRFDAHLHVWQGLDLKDDQDELAALMPALDMVVTAFTITAQMAGALGVPAWVLSHLGNQSWWGFGTDYCPWHPSIQFWPCGALEPWETAIGELATQLRERYR